MTYNYEAALKDINEFCASGPEMTWEDGANMLALHRHTLRHALRIAAELQEKPSDEMNDCGIEAYLDFKSKTNVATERIFKAMVAQLLKEVEDG